MMRCDSYRSLIVENQDRDLKLLKMLKGQEYLKAFKVESKHGLTGVTRVSPEFQHVISKAKLLIK